MLENVLTKEQREAGLYLGEDEDIVYLLKKGKVAPLATFSAAGATIEAILHEADQQLEWHRSGITFEKVEGNDGS